MSKSKDDLSQSKLLLERGSVFESIVGVQKAGEIMKARIYNQIEPPEDGNDLDLSDCGYCISSSLIQPELN